MKIIQNCLIWSSNSSLVRLIKPPGAPSASPTRAQQIGNRMVVKFLSGCEFKVKHSNSSTNLALVNSRSSIIVDLVICQSYFPKGQKSFKDLSLTDYGRPMKAFFINLQNW